MLDFSRPLQTRSGLPVRLLGYNFKNENGPLLIAITYEDGVERIGWRREDGAYPLKGSSQWDVVYAVKREVVVTVEDGMADIYSLPADVEVTIVDYDVDGIEGEDLLEHDGRPCIIHRYGPGEKP
ncbi:hypothetical protein ACFLEY_22215 [Bradyrhizobium sp. YCK136]|uniref:hypothetical protein n=1 Tax=Bradyrhizobium sp. YCK136 TaxID=3351346 RepID=UPI0037C51C59